MICNYTECDTCNMPKEEKRKNDFNKWNKTVEWCSVCAIAGVCIWKWYSRSG